MANWTWICTAQYSTMVPSETSGQETGLYIASTLVSRRSDAGRACGRPTKAMQACSQSALEHWKAAKFSCAPRRGAIRKDRLYESYLSLRRNNRFTE